MYFCVDELIKERDAKRKLEEDLKTLQDELNETKSQVTIAELQKNDVEVERQRYQGDLKTLRRKYDGKTCLNYQINGFQAII